MNKHQIFATGVHLTPIKVDKKWWGWVASQFEDDSFRDGKVYNPPERAETLEELTMMGKEGHCAHCGSSNMEYKAVDSSEFPEVDSLCVEGECYECAQFSQAWYSLKHVETIKKPPSQKLKGEEE